MALSDRTRRWLILWGSIFALLSTLGLLNAISVIGDRLTSGQPFRWHEPFATEMTGAYSVLLLMPLLLWVMRRYPIGRRDWPARVPLHLGASVLFGVSSTLIMWGSRRLLWRAFGWGFYDVGDLRFRFPMEYTKQFMAYVVLYGCVAGYAYVRRTREQELRAKELERQLAEARLAALKMQLNPHFLFNTLNMISSFIYQDPKKADAMLAHLSDFLRLTLSRAEAQEVPLEAELRFLNGYLGIMAARFGDGLAVKVQAGPDVRRALVPHLILQPLVENAIRHCTGEAGHPGRIEVAATAGGGRLTLEVQDDGPGLAETPEAALSGGVGLSNTAGRLKALYGDDHRLVLDRGPLGGLRVTLDLPLREPEGEAAPP